MTRHKKGAKFLSTLLALVMLLTLLPLNALAAETQILVQMPSMSSYLAKGSYPSDDELFAAYVDSVLYSTPASYSSTNEGSKLTGTARELYFALKPLVKQVASGQLKSTKLEGFLIPLNANNIDAAKAEVGAFFRSVLTALLADEPETLFWFDKTKGVTVGYLYNNRGEFWIGGVQMPVSSDYGVDYTVTEDLTRVETARAIAESMAASEILDNLSPYQVMSAFDALICTLTDYDTDAVLNPTTPYGDPWQLINVFDADDNTKVVCEGYSKAFQYLCDLRGLTCYTVAGDLGFPDENGYEDVGGHMWNVVPMNGKNYIVDVTNNDSPNGSTGELFMIGGQTAGTKVTHDFGPDFYFSYDYSTTDNNSLYPISADNYLMGTAATYNPATLTVSKTQLANAANYAALGLPETVTVALNEQVTESGTLPYAIDGWSMTLEELRAIVLNGVDQTITLTPTLKQFHNVTVPDSILGYPLTLTAKETVKLTVTQPDGIYGTELANPTVVQSEIIPGTGTETDNPSYTYLYEGVGGTNYPASATKPVNAGDYKVTATLVSTGYAGTGSANFTIAAKPLTADGVTVTLAEGPFVYNGQPHKPAVTVADTKATITTNDYTVAYSNNVNAGIATVMVTGKGNYTNSKPAYFTIDKASLDTLTPTLTGSAAVGNVLTASLPGVASTEVDWQWTIGGNTLAGHTDKAYTLSSDTSNKAITVKAVAKSAGNYTGTSLPSATVTVAKQSIYGAVGLQCFYVDEDGNRTPSSTVNSAYTLSADISSINPSLAHSDLVYEWKIDDQVQAGETDADFVIPADSNGKRITVTVTADGDFTGSITSSAVEVGKAILTGTLTVQKGGTDVSTAALDDVLTANLAGGDSDAAFTYAWYCDGVQVGTEETYTVKKADQGKTLYVTITGTGSYTGTLISSTVKISAAAPDAPVITANAGNEQVTLSWTKPDGNGAPITGYTVSYKPTASSDAAVTVTLPESATSYTVTGLTNDTEYTLKLTATNSVGSTDSNSVTATPTSYSGGGSTGGSSTPPKTETVTNPDGSVTKTETTTKTDGSTGATVTTVIATTTATDGTITKVETIEVKGGNDGVTATAKVTTDADGKRNADVSIALPEGKNTNKIALPTDIVKAATGADSAAVTVETPNATIELDKAALQAIVKVGGNTPVLTMTPVADDKLPAALKGAKAIEITVNGKGVDFGSGVATVSVPYTKKDAANVAVVSLVAADGTSTRQSGVSYKNGAVTFTTPHWSIYAITEEKAMPFTDVQEGMWFYESVHFTFTKQLFSGTTATTFSPNAPMTRAMLWTVLGRMEGQTFSGGANWYEAAQKWAMGKGITDGTMPNGSITREQLAVMLYRVAGNPASTGELSIFADGAKVSTWALDAVKWATEQGILAGKTGGLLDPQGAATRAEVSVMLMRYLSK